MPKSLFFYIFAQNIKYKKIIGKEENMIVGRKEEIAELDKLYYSDRPEFVAIYGRRRVGKTFLIKQALKDRITFQHTGVSPVDQDNDRNRLKTQLESFYYALLNQGLEGYKMPKSWMEAFFLLEQLLQDQDNGERQVIFIDELPWMDTPVPDFFQPSRTSGMAGVVAGTISCLWFAVVLLPGFSVIYQEAKEDSTDA